MENDLKEIENYFDLCEVRVIEGSSYRESTVPVNMQSTSLILNLMLVRFGGCSFKTFFIGLFRDP